MGKYNVSLRLKEPKANSIPYEINMLSISIESETFIDACIKAEDYLSRAFGVAMIADGGFKEYEDSEKDNLKED